MKPGRQSACSKLHPATPGGPCAMCKKTNDQSYWHILSAISPQNDQLVDNLRSKNISDSDCICKSCKLKYSRKRPVETDLHGCEIHCCVCRCTESSQFHHVDYSKAELEALLNLPANTVCCNEVSLCHVHFMRLFHLQTKQVCCACDKESTSKNPMTNFRRVSQQSADIIWYRKFRKLKYKDVDPRDFICNPCRVTVSVFSGSDDYHNVVNSDKVTLQERFSRFHLTTETCAAEELAFAKTMLHLEEQLLSNKPVLLQTLTQLYSTTMGADFPSPDPESFRQKIINSVGGVVLFSSVKNQPRVGTLIRRCGSDVLEMLHLHMFENDKSVCDSSSVSSYEQPLKSSSIKLKLREVAEYLNSELQNHSVDLMKHNKSPSSLTDFSVMAHVHNLPPHFWNFILLLTLGKNEKSTMDQMLKQGKGKFDWQTHFSIPLYKTPSQNLNKVLRRYFISACMLFCINRECSFPLHILLADVVDKYTQSSSECISILSKFGAVVSKDTLLRYQVQCSKLLMKEKESVLTSSFCVASVDNIDWNSNFSTVSSSDKGRGFHGTSVQAIEPRATALEVRPSSCNISRTDRSIPVSVLQQYHDVPPMGRTDTLSFSGRRFTACIGDFHLSELEKECLRRFQFSIFKYMLFKELARSEHSDVFLPDLRDTLKCLSPVVVETSRIHYTTLLAKPADSKETLLEVLSILHAKHKVGIVVDYLVVVGDGKTYDHLINLKREYIEELAWMLPYIGEWHTLKNMQAPLLKVYLESGLKKLLDMFHHGATGRAVSNATSYQKCHEFLTQSWEAFYRCQIAEFFKVSKLSLSTPALFNKMPTSGQEYLDLMKANDISDTCSELQCRFEAFCKETSSKSATFKFWNGFCHRDMIYYISLYLSIRSRNFVLRQVSMKSIGPIFHALDRQLYLKLIPYSLADLFQFPAELQEEFLRGGFAVSYSEEGWRCVAFDECHEMDINRKVKNSKPSDSDEVISRLCHYLPHRALVLDNLQKEVGKKTYNKNPAVYAKIHELNVRAYITPIQDSVLFSDTANSPTVVRHLFSELEASNTVSINLLQYYDKGKASFFDYIKCAILCNHGVKMPSRSRLNLQFLGKKKTTVHRQKKEISDQKLQIQCLRKQLAMSRHSNTPVAELQQFVALPRALCKADGKPHKPPKSVISQLYEQQYPDAFSSTFPSVTNRLGYFIDGMVLISSTPVSPQKTFKDYIDRLFSRWVLLPLIKHCAAEVHMIFDHPNRHGISPKDVERSMRDSNILAAESQDHDTNIMNIALESLLPCKSNWGAFLANRPQKRKLVNLVCSRFLTLAQSFVDVSKVFVISGGFDGESTDKAYEVSNGQIHENPVYFSNHEEGDTRVWLHVSKSSCQSAVVYSIDRDVMHVGMPLVNTLHDKQIFVHLRSKVADDLFCNLNQLVVGFENDLSLRRIGSELLHLLPCFLQVLFVCSGCDFVSGFASHPKRQFLNVFRRDCSFITGDRSQGFLNDTDHANIDKGLLAFYRLIGCIYFRAHASAFSVESPSDLFSSFNSSSLLNAHIAFLSAIRTGHFHRVASEEHWMPSPEALKFHWFRTCYTINVWNQCNNNIIILPDMFEHGWSMVDNQLEVIWDTPENIKRVNDQVKMLKSGCGCKKGCKANCGCRKQQKLCSINCKCRNCQNIHTLSLAAVETDAQDEEIMEDDDDEEEVGEEDGDEQIFEGDGQFQQGEEDISHASIFSPQSDINSAVNENEETIECEFIIESEFLEDD